MYNKLKQFGSDQESKQTSSTFLERLAFWKKEKHRTKCLEQLHKWNKRLGCLTYNVPLTNLAAVIQSQSGTPVQSVLSHRRVPSIQLRRLSQQLHQALLQCWDCCAIRHEARFCLRVQEKILGDEEAAEFEFFVSSHVERNHQCTWREGHILMRSGG